MNEEYYIDTVRAILFSILTYSLDGCFEVYIKKTGSGADVTVRKGSMPPAEKHITDRSWNQFLNKLLYDYRLLDWKKNYKPKDAIIFDGESWVLELKLDGRKRRTWRGDNHYPACWSKMLKEFNNISKTK